MGLFNKLKSMVSGEEASENKNAAPKQTAIRLTEKQLTIKEWLAALSPEWQAALNNGWSALSVDQTDEELEKRFRELVSLEVSDNAKIKDLSPVAELSFLKELDVSECRVSDLSPLKNLQLEKLTITNNPIKDLGPLSEMASLKKLRFGGRDFKLIDTIDPLANLVNLEEISMVDSLVSSVKALNNCKSLKELNAADSQLNSFEGLENCTQLERISVHRTFVGDLSPLAALTNLKFLALFHCPNVRDISIAANFAKMEELDIAYTGVTDLQPLYGLSNLEELSSSGWLKDQNAAFQQARPTCKVAEFG
jgi:Leucine-rich repeat (LRR) protein